MRIVKNYSCSSINTLQYWSEDLKLSYYKDCDSTIKKLSKNRILPLQTKLISEFTQKKFKIYNSHILKTFKMMSVSSMSKREKRIKFLKKELKKMKKKHWPFIDAFYQNEMIPIIEYLKKDNGIINSLKPPLKKYLIISRVSLIERSLLLLTVRIIDEDKIDLEPIPKLASYKQ